MTSSSEPTKEPGAGYKQPPVSTRFRKGQSGNPKGRPRNRHRDIPYDTILGQMVTIREDGKERRVTAAEAFLLQLTRKGLAGDSAAARASLEAIEVARKRRVGLVAPEVTRITVISYGIGSTLKTLGLALKTDPLDRSKVRWWLNPWIVEAALARLGSRQLSEDEQREVWENTRTPQKVKWPAWWSERG